jgi:hypothetical protein
MPGPLHDVVTGAFSNALHDMFLSAVPLVLVALVVAFFLKELPLGTRAAHGEVPQPVGPAQGAESAGAAPSSSSPTSV